MLHLYILNVAVVLFRCRNRVSDGKILIGHPDTSKPEKKKFRSHRTSRAPALSRINRPSAFATPIRAAAAASQTLEALGLFSLCAATRERESREGEEKKK